MQMQIGPTVFNCVHALAGSSTAKSALSAYAWSIGAAGTCRSGETVTPGSRRSNKPTPDCNADRKKSRGGQGVVGWGGVSRMGLGTDVGCFWNRVLHFTDLVCRLLHNLCYFQESVTRFPWKYPIIKIGISTYVHMTSSSLWRTYYTLYIQYVTHGFKNSHKFWPRWRHGR